MGIWGFDWYYSVIIIVMSHAPFGIGYQDGVYNLSYVIRES